MISQFGTTVAQSITIKRDLPDKKQPSYTFIFPPCLCKISSKSPPKLPRLTSVLKHVAQAKFCLMNLFIDRCPPRFRNVRAFQMELGFKNFGF